MPRLKKLTPLQRLARNRKGSFSVKPRRFWHDDWSNGRMTLRLYDLAGADPNRRFSPYCWRIRLALAHKRLPVETIPGDGLTSDQYDSGYVRAVSWTLPLPR
jgi:glutathione S-transferase-like protein